MANFAKTQLLKYGWTEGKGLGKNENGIKEALKTKLKFNTEGLGHKPLEEVEWWKSTFNNTINNVSISPEGDGISISVTNKNATSILMDKNLKEDPSRQKQYSNFLKTCMLQDEKVNMFENDNKKQKGEEKSVKISTLTDDELFKACEGRTMHKGARHGLKLNGKLERIARQEKQLLRFMSNLDNKGTINKSTSKIENNVVENVHEDANSTNITLATTSTSCNVKDNFMKSKATLKKEKKRMRNLSHLLNISCNIDENSSGSTTVINDRKPNLKRKRSKDTRTNIDIHIANSNMDTTFTLGESLMLLPHSNSILEEKKNKQENGESSKAIDSSALKRLKCQNKEIVKLMKKMNFGNSKDKHVKNKKSSSVSDEIIFEYGLSSREKKKKKKNRLHKKNKEERHLKKHLAVACTKKSLNAVKDILSTLVDYNITEDVSMRLKKPQKHITQ